MTEATIADLINFAKKEFLLLPHKTVLKILADYLNSDISYVLAHPEFIVEESINQKFHVALQELTMGKPLAYILGQEKFFEHKFFVDENTLIPRIETELLVELVLKQFQAKENISILDLGTGSGNIAISLAAAHSHWKIIAVDNNELTLEVAKKNAACLLSCPSPAPAEHPFPQGKRVFSCQIEFLLSDWFANIPPSARFHAIVSNPPYIAENDPDISASVKNFEPHRAFFAQDEGLADLKIIIAQAKKYLYPGGMLAVEHGHTQHTEVKKLFEENNYQNISFILDHQNIHRVCYGYIPLVDESL